MNIRYFTLLIIVLLVSLPVAAVPKYTNKKNAVTLALAVEKGYYDGAIILAAYAMNRNNNYYVAVTLSNGRTERWYLEDIYKFSRDGKLSLRGNKVLIFPDADTGNFEILDKNLFHRMAIKATAIREIYDGYDSPLAGQSLLYKIKEFFLIPPEDTSYGKDPYGYPYRYRVNLYNCNTILLSYRDVLMYLNNRQLLKDASAQELKPLELPYTVKSITGFNKTLDQVYSQFGILVTFDRNIDLVPDNFPVIIRETGSGAKDGQREKQYIVDMIMPNTSTQHAISLNGNTRETSLEYLRDVKVIPDGKNKCQSILRATFNYELMDIPPYITKIADNKIYITFFNITDQTISEPPVTLAEAQQITAESRKWLSVSPSVQVNSDFGRYYSAAVEKINEGYFEESYKSAVDKLREGISLLEKAGLLTTEDNQLLEILNTRNSVRERIVYLSIDNAVNELQRTRPDNAKIKDYLANADEFSDNAKQQNDIRKIKERANL